MNDERPVKSKFLMKITYFKKEGEELKQSKKKLRKYMRLLINLVKKKFYVSCQKNVLS